MGAADAEEVKPAVISCHRRLARTRSDGKLIPWERRGVPGGVETATLRTDLVGSLGLDWIHTGCWIEGISKVTLFPPANRCVRLEWFSLNTKSKCDGTDEGKPKYTGQQNDS